MTRVLIAADDESKFRLVETQCLVRNHQCVFCIGREAAMGALGDAPFELVISAAPFFLAADAEFVRKVHAQVGQQSVYLLAICEGADTIDLARLMNCGVDECLTQPVCNTQWSLRLEIAERRLRERAEQCLLKQSLRDTADQLALAAAATSDGFWHTQLYADGSYDLNLPIWYSPQLKALIGFADDEFENVLSSWANRVHPDDRERVFQAIDDQLYRRVPFDIEYRLQVRSGEYRWFSARGQTSWDSAGQPQKMAGSLRDITQRRAEHDALRESEANYRLIAQTVDDIIWTVEIPNMLQSESTAAEIAAAMRRLSISYISPAIERVLGYSTSEARQLTLDQLLTPAAYHLVLGEFYQEFGPLANRQVSEQRVMELDHVTRDGGICCCEICCTVIRDAEGLPRRVTGVSRDITERKRAETALRREREFLRRLVDVHERERQFFAYAIHDGVMPDITAALMHLESSRGEKPVAQETGSDFAEGVKLLRSAGDSTRRLIGVLRPPILDEAGVVGALEYLVNEIRLEMPEVNFACQVAFERLDPPLENAVFRCVQEALTNVRRHSRCRRAEVRLRQTGDRLLVEVQDWGIGFNPDQVSEDRFGLQAIRERARLLGGRAMIESAPGHGARISVDFPLTVAG